MKALALGVLALILVYIGGCSAISAHRSHGFESIRVGDSRASVLLAMGAPGVIERPPQVFMRYASTGCSACSERLWYENRLSLDTQAWSVEIDSGGSVIRTTRWTSP